MFGRWVINGRTDGQPSFAIWAPQRERQSPVGLRLRLGGVMKAGFIGIGNGAHPWRATFSPNLLKASRRITVYNRTRDKAAILEATGVR